MDVPPRLTLVNVRNKMMRVIIAYLFMRLLRNPTLARRSFCIVVRLAILFLVRRKPLYLNAHPMRCGWNMMLNVVRLQYLTCTSVVCNVAVVSERHQGIPWIWWVQSGFHVRSTPRCIPPNCAGCRGVCALCLLYLLPYFAFKYASSACCLTK